MSKQALYQGWRVGGSSPLLRPEKVLTAGSTCSSMSAGGGLVDKVHSKSRLQLKFTEQFIRNLKASAAQAGMSPSELVWEAYREWVLRHEGGKGDDSR